MTDMLPNELLWAEGGHASDVVLTALADAQDAIVPADVKAHVATCPACTTHLGNAVLLSLHTAKQMHVAAKPIRRPLPRAAIALGLGVAGLGLVPSFLDGQLGAGASHVLHEAPILAHGLRSAVMHAAEGRTGLAFTYGTALVVMAMAAVVVRLLPKKETSQ